MIVAGTCLAGATQQNSLPCLDWWDLSSLPVLAALPTTFLRLPLFANSHHLPSRACYSFKHLKC